MSISKPNSIRRAYDRLNQKYKKTMRLLKVLLLLVLCSFIMAEGLVLSQFQRDDRHSVDAHYIIILGSGLEGAELSETLRLRVDTGLAYWREHPDKKMIVSGGQGPDEDVPEAKAMHDYLVKQGVPEKAVLLEQRSTSTYENLLFSEKIMDEDAYSASGDYEAVIVTSNYHMYRATLLANRLGYKGVYGISSNSPVSLLPYTLLREYPALIKAVWMTL